MEATLKEVLHQARVLAGQQKFVEAQKLYASWLQKFENKTPSELEPDIIASVATAYNNLGHLKYMNVDFDEAVKEYDRALTYDPDMASAYYNRGTIMYRMGHFDKALTDMKRATALNPDNQEFQIGLQRSLAQLLVESSSENS